MPLVAAHGVEPRLAGQHLGPDGQVLGHLVVGVIALDGDAFGVGHLGGIEEGCAGEAGQEDCEAVGPIGDRADAHGRI
jgi:hypothetical protein